MDLATEALKEEEAKRNLIRDIRLILSLYEKEPLGNLSDILFSSNYTPKGEKLKGSAVTMGSGCEDFFTQAAKAIIDNYNKQKE